MKRLLIVYFVCVVLAIGVLAQVSNVDRVIIHADARTIASTGNSAVATLTLAPKTGYVPITCNDPDSCAITMSETGMSDGQGLVIENRSTNLVTFAPSVGVLELACPIELAQYRSLRLTYMNDRWVGEWLGPCIESVTLSDAQIKGLPTTPIAIIAAPGAGYRTHVLSASLVVKSVSGGYSNINTAYSSLALQVVSGAWVATPVENDGSFTSPMTHLTTFLGGTNEKVAQLVGGWVVGIQDSASGDHLSIAPNMVMPSLADYTNQVIYIAMDNNGSLDLTGGNSGNTLRVTVYYIKEAT